MVTRLRELAEGDADFLQEVYESFLDDSRQRLTSFHEAVAGGDADAMRRLAHSVKGAAANVGAIHVAETAHELQLLGETGTVAGAAPLVEKLQRELEFVTAEIENQLGIVHAA
jgi:HPt (histidine-containing phosphotransfer) domain-containing protein